tara:strand:- start:7780 stop:8784 length:1005 start_codon:yes stop_codon:yes gene_type:complete
MIYKIGNQINDIKNLLISLKDKYDDYAFISYIDGEYGIRVWVYNSLCYDFYKKCRQNNKTVVGICFKGTKSFLTPVCDHIIEIQDIAFNITTEEIADNSQYSSNHSNDGFVANNLYQGNDGWRLEYIRGLHCDEYEKMLEEIKFENIFYTLHCDGSRYINKKGWTNTDGCIKPYKINNTDFSLASIQNWMENNLFIEEKEYNSYTNNAISIWVRNTNKWPQRNMQPVIYNAVFDYCINNKKKCYVFQDLIPIKLPNNEYIIDSTIRFKQRPDFDNFIDICNKCDYFIGADSGPIHLLNVLKTSNRNICLCNHRLLKNIIISNNPIDIIKNYYEN